VEIKVFLKFLNVCFTLSKELPKAKAFAGSFLPTYSNQIDLSKEAQSGKCLNTEIEIQLVFFKLCNFQED